MTMPLREMAGGIFIVEVDSEVDLVKTNGVTQQVQDLIARGITRIIVNLTQIRSIDSAGLATFLAVTKRVRRQGGRIAFVVSSKSALRLFALTGFDRVFDLQPTEDDALRAVVDASF